MRSAAWMVILPLISAGCVDSPSESAAPAAAEQASEAPAAAAPAPAPLVGPDPCEQLTEAALRAALSLPERVQVSQSQRRSTTSSACEYTWRDPDVDEATRRREMMEKVRQAVREGRDPGGVAALAAAGGPPEVRYMYTPPAPDAAEARERFETAMRRLNEGVTHELPNVGGAGPQTFTLQATTETIEGVGDAAQWSPRLQQLFVLRGNRMFHLSVRVEAEAAANLELAKALAAAVTD